MSPASQKDAPAAGAAVEVPAATNGGFASRDDILGAAGNFAEAEYELEGVGKLLLSEISGKARAEILGQMATAIEGNKLSDPTWTAKYQKAMLKNGVVDPSSPAGARNPLFREGDLDRLMQLGGAKIASVVDEIERLSRMGSYQESAEGNSVITLNGGSSSG